MAMSGLPIATYMRESCSLPSTFLGARFIPIARFMKASLKSDIFPDFRMFSAFSIL